MKITAYILLACGVISISSFLIKRDNNGSALALLLKLISSLLFVFVGIFSMMNSVDNNGITLRVILPYILIISGLIFGLIGDMLLDLKIIYPKDNDLYTFSGMISFAIGHIFYIVALCLIFGLTNHNWNIYYSMAISVLITALVIFVSIKFVKLEYGKFLIISIIYLFILSVVTVNTVAMTIAIGFTAFNVMQSIAFLMFMLSDCLLCTMYFGKNNNKPFIVLNHTTYYIAQFLIALSLLYL